MVIPDIAWAILLMVLGCALIVLEVFIPSGGLISILSGVAFIASIVIASWQSPTTGPFTGLAFAAATVVVVPILIATAFKYWPKTPMGKAFLGEPLTGDDVLPEDSRRALLGRVGVARSKMLPSGAVEVDGQVIDATTQGGQPIEPGTYVVITEVRANRVIVSPAGKDQRPGHQSAKDIKNILDRPIDELGIEPLDDPLA
jgi:membrane-bound serine protease (ClpP class)